MQDADKSLEQLESELTAEASQDNAASSADGTGSANEATDSQSTEGEQVEDSVALKAELEQARKELQKIEMERNLLRNKEKKAEQERLEKVDREKLDEVQSAYDQLLAEKKERDAREEEEVTRKELQSFRDSVIAQRPEAVQKAARALIEKNENNVSWTNAKSEDDARAQLDATLDAIQALVAPAGQEAEQQVQVHANNPGRPIQDKPFEEQTLEEMEKTLPWADPR